MRISTEFDRFHRFSYRRDCLLRTRLLQTRCRRYLESVLWGRHAYIYSKLTTADQRNRSFSIFLRHGMTTMTEGLRTDFTATTEVFSQSGRIRSDIRFGNIVKWTRAVGKEFEAFTENYYPGSVGLCNGHFRRLTRLRYGRIGRNQSPEICHLQAEDEMSI